MIVTAERHFTHNLTDLINNMAAPKKTIVKLIHITTHAQYVMAVTKLMREDKWPSVIARKYSGECYIENTHNYLVYEPKDWNVTKEDSEIIPFEDFINDHK